jgi:hypothetical protein
MKPAKIWERIIAGSRDIRFRDFEQLLRAFGFEFDRQSAATGSTGNPSYVFVSTSNRRAERPNSILELVETYGLRLRD